MRNSSFLAALHDLFEVDAGTIQETSVLQDIPGWSSLTFIGLIATIDDECLIDRPRAMGHRPFDHGQILPLDVVRLEKLLKGPHRRRSAGERQRA